jgi:hypothetical protein
MVLRWGACQTKHRPVQQIDRDYVAMGIDMGKNSFPVVGLDRRGAILLRQPWPRGQIKARPRKAAVPDWHASPCGAQHLSQELQARRHDARPMSVKWQKKIFATRKRWPRRRRTRR